jgi:hypothetical protein
MTAVDSGSQLMRVWFGVAAGARVGKMPRKATSPLEIEQIQRVCALLGRIGVCPAPNLMISTADGRTHVGQFAWQKVGTRPGRRRTDNAYYGSLQLRTADRRVEIDYLDIVTIQPQ